MTVSNSGAGLGLAYDMHPCKPLHLCRCYAPAFADYTYQTWPGHFSLMRISCTYTRRPQTETYGRVYDGFRVFMGMHGLNTSLYTRIHRCPTRFVRKSPPCLRKYHLAEKYSPVNTWSTFIGRTPRGRYFLIGHSRFYLFVHRPHSGSVLRNE